MTRSTKSVAFASLIALAGLLAAPAARAETCAATLLEGSWMVEVTLQAPPPGFPPSFTALETYSRGCGLVTSNDLAGLRALGQGEWRQEGARRFGARIFFFVFDPSNTLTGSIAVTHTLRVAGGGAYSGEGQAELLDPDGNPLAVIPFTSAGIRLWSAIDGS